MQVVVAPDSFGGTLTAREAADAIVAGWREARPDDVVVAVPMSDGGEGLLDVLADPTDTRIMVEVAGPLGTPVEAPVLLRADGRAVIESATACGLYLLAPDRRNPMLTTTYGVGQLLDAAREAGATRVLVGVGGSATVDGGAGALTALGWRLITADGGGLKVGGDQLHAIDRIDRGWAADWSGIDVEVAVDVRTTLRDAARRFGPQKGATPAQVEALARALDIWADVVTRDLTAGSDGRDQSGTGAAGGLGFGLAAALGARLVPGARTVADLLGLHDRVAGADVVVTGEGRLDGTSREGKVVAEVADAARSAGVRTFAVAGQRGDDVPALDAVEVAAPDGPGPDPHAEVRAATARLAARATTS